MAPRDPGPERSPLAALSVRFYTLLAALALLTLTPALVGILARRNIDGFAPAVQEAGSLRYRLLLIEIDLPRVTTDLEAEARVRTMVQDQRRVLSTLIVGSPSAGVPECPTADVCSRLGDHLRRWDDTLGPRIQAALRGDPSTLSSRELRTEVSELDLTVRAIARTVQERAEANERLGIGISVGSVLLVGLVAYGVWEAFNRIRKLRALVQQGAEKAVRGYGQGNDEIAALAAALADGLRDARQRRSADQHRAAQLEKQQAATRRVAESLGAWLAGEAELETPLADIAAATGYATARLTRGTARSDAGADGEDPNLTRVPLTSGAVQLGVLELGGGGAVSERDQDLVTALSQILAIACVAEKLVTEKSEQGRLAVAIGSVTAREPTASEFGATLNRLVAHDAALIEVSDASGRIQDTWDVQPDRLVRLATVCEGHSGDQVRVLSGDAEETCQLLMQRCPGAQLLLTPLRVSDRTLGHLVMARKTGEFSAHDIQAAEALAPVVASALARIQLEGRLRFAEQWSTVGAFGRLLAHEIKNPLNSLGLELQLLGRRVTKLSLPEEDKSKLTSSVGVVRSELARLTALTNDYLSLTPRAGELALVAVDLSAIVAEVARTHAATLAERGIALELRSAEQPEIVRGNPDRLKQLLHNLIGNAIDAMSDSEDRRLAITIRERGQDIELAVRDSGPGIEDPQAIFTPGFSTKPSGTGMGLAISQQIAHQHGGQLTARAVHPRGAELALVLRRYDEPPPSSAAERAEA